MKARLTFHGGVGMVTGSNFLLEIDGKKVLVDCGFFQGCNVCDVKTLAPFLYDPGSIDFVFVTHAHLDHTGRIPKLVKDGFRGKIISTPPTKDIAEIMYDDSLEFLEEEARAGKYEQIYGKKEINETLELWETVSYHEPVSITENVKVALLDAGHVLGSAMIEVESGGTKLVFTGDLGNSPSPLLKETESIGGVTYLVTESVYGDKRHEQVEDRRRRLEEVVERAVKAKGALLIPAFSIERTQEILFEIKRMMLNYQTPLVPVYVDSPLAIRVIDVYKKYNDYYNKDVKHIVGSADELFVFPQIHLVSSKDDSKAIANVKNPKIIIAGSGMSNGGRIIFHEKRYLPDPASVILFIGYQAPGSLGREIQDGARRVRIMNEEVTVNARVETIQSYSAHKDTEKLVQFVVGSADTLKKVFVVMGEPKSSAFLTQRLRDYVGVDATVPKEGDIAELEF